MNRPGKLTDDAHMEVIFSAPLKSDVVHGVVFEQEEGAEHKMMRSYIPF